MKKTLVPYYLAGLILLLAIGCKKAKEPEYIDMENLHVSKAGISESIVGADLKYYNPNSFDLQLRKANLDVYVNEKYVGHSDLDTLIQIPAKDTFYVPITMKLNLGDLLKNAVQLFLDPEVKLKIEGTARVGKSGIYKNIPVSYEGKERIDVLMKDSSFRRLISIF
jgi:LEA14-like dessication related protein